MSIVRDIWALLCTFYFTFGKTKDQSYQDLFTGVHVFVREQLDSLQRDSEPFIKDLYKWFISYAIDFNNDNQYIYFKLVQFLLIRFMREHDNFSTNDKIEGFLTIIQYRESKTMDDIKPLLLSYSVSKTILLEESRKLQETNSAFKETIEKFTDLLINDKNFNDTSLYDLTEYSIEVNDKDIQKFIDDYTNHLLRLASEPRLDIIQFYYILYKLDEQKTAWKYKKSRVKTANPGTIKMEVDEDKTDSVPKIRSLLRPKGSTKTASRHVTPAPTPVNADVVDMQESDQDSPMQKKSTPDDIFQSNFKDLYTFSVNINEDDYIEYSEKIKKILVKIQISTYDESFQKKIYNKIKEDLIVPNLVRLLVNLDSVRKRRGSIVQSKYNKLFSSLTSFERSVILSNKQLVDLINPDITETLKIIYAYPHMKDVTDEDSYDVYKEEIKNKLEEIHQEITQLDTLFAQYEMHTYIDMIRHTLFLHVLKQYENFLPKETILDRILDDDLYKGISIDQKNELLKLYAVAPTPTPVPIKTKASTKPSSKRLPVVVAITDSKQFKSIIQNSTPFVVADFTRNIYSINKMVIDFENDPVAPATNEMKRIIEQEIYKPLLEIFFSIPSHPPIITYANRIKVAVLNIPELQTKIDSDIMAAFKMLFPQPRDFMVKFTDPGAFNTWQLSEITKGETLENEVIKDINVDEVTKKKMKYYLQKNVARLILNSWVSSNKINNQIKLEDLLGYHLLLESDKIAYKRTQTVRFGSPHTYTDEEKTRTFDSLFAKVSNIIQRKELDILNIDDIFDVISTVDEYNIVHKWVEEGEMIDETKYPVIAKILNDTSKVPSKSKSKSKIDLMKDENVKISAMINKYFQEVIALMRRKHYDTNGSEEYKQLYKDIGELLKIDQSLNTEYDELVYKLKDFDKNINEGIRKEFFDLKHKLLELQLSILVRKESRKLHRDPNIKRIIEMLNDKIEVIKQIMKTTVEEEMDFEGLDGMDADLIRYNSGIYPGEKGASKDQDSHTKHEIQTIYDKFAFHEVENPSKGLFELDIEVLDKLLKQDVLVKLKSEHEVYFGDIINKIVPNYQSNLFTEIFHERLHTEDQFYFVTFRIVTYLFIEVSKLFAKDTVTKICNLLISDDIERDEKYTECVRSLFLPVIQEDIDICDILKCNVAHPIDNDTPIALKFLKFVPNAKFVFVFRYISILYNSFFKQSVDKKSFFKPKHIMDFYTVCMRILYYLHMLSLVIIDHKIHIDDLYKQHVKNIIPVDIYVKERNNTENKNPRYNVTTSNDDDNLKLTVNYINNPYRVGYFSSDAQGTTVRVEMDRLHIEPDRKLMYSYNLAREQLTAATGLVYDANIKNLATNDIKNESKTETYYIGNITGYIEGKGTEYPKKDDLQKKFKEYIKENRDIIVLGYGQSGSGKTSALIKLKNPSTKGIIPTLMDSLDSNEYVKLEVDFINIYLNWSAELSRFSDVLDEHYLLRKLVPEKIFFTRNSSNYWVSTKSIVDGVLVDGESELSQVIIDAFDLRETEPTENNPESSRSHVLISMQLYKKHTAFGSKIIIADLAGVENEFACNVEKITTLDKVYGTESPKYNLTHGKHEIFFDSYGLGEKFDIPSFQTKLKSTSNQENIVLIRYNIIHQIRQLIHFQKAGIEGDTQYSMPQLSRNQILTTTGVCELFNFQSKVIPDNIISDFLLADNETESIENLIKDYLGDPHHRKLHPKFLDLYQFDKHFYDKCSIDLKQEIENHFMKIIFQLHQSAMVLERINNHGWKLPINLGNAVTANIIKPQIEKLFINMDNYFAKVQTAFSDEFAKLSQKDQDGAVKDKENRHKAVILVKYFMDILSPSIKDQIINIQPGYPATRRVNSHDFDLKASATSGLTDDFPIQIKIMYNENDFSMLERYLKLDDSDVKINADFVYARVISNGNFMNLMPDVNTNGDFLFDTYSLSDLQRKVPTDAYMFQDPEQLIDVLYSDSLDMADPYYTSPDVKKHLKQLLKDYVAMDITSNTKSKIETDMKRKITTVLGSHDWDKKNVSVNTIFSLLQHLNMIFKTYLSFGVYDKKFHPDHLKDLKDMMRLEVMYIKQGNTYVYNGTRKNWLTYKAIEAVEKVSTGVTTPTPEFDYYNSFQNIVTKFQSLSETISPSITGTTNTKVDRNKGLLMPFIYAISDTNALISKINITINQVIRDFIFYEIYAFNCMLRRKEGFFINQSLVQMKTTITNFMIYSMSKKMKISTVTSMIPQLLYYMQPSDDGCINKNYTNSMFSVFNIEKQITMNDVRNNKSEIVLKLVFEKGKINLSDVEGLGLDVNKTKLMVFTVINTNDNDNKPNSKDDLTLPLPDNPDKKISNNPPVPPYINTNMLKKFYKFCLYLNNIESYIKKVDDTLDNTKELDKEYKTVKAAMEAEYTAKIEHFLDRLNLYSFYREDSIIESIIKEWRLNFMNTQQLIQLIEYIERNNETTFIGTLNFMKFTTILDPDGLYPICCDDDQFIDIAEI